MPTQQTMTGARRPSDLPLPPVLLWFLLGSLFCTVAAFADLMVSRHVLHLTGNPYADYLLSPSIDYYDIQCYQLRFHHVHSSAFFDPAYGLIPWTYPGTNALFYAALYLLPHVLSCYLLLCAVALVALTEMFRRRLVAEGLSVLPATLFAAAALVLSYPVYFVLNRGNLEIFTWVLAACGVYLVLHRRSMAGAILIGVAASMKFYPAVYLVLLISRRKYREIGVAIGSGTVLNLCGLWLIDPNLMECWSKVRGGGNFFYTVVALRYLAPRLDFDHSLFAFVKRLFPYRSEATYGALSKGCFCTLLLLTVVLFIVRIRKLPVMNQVLCLTIASVLFMPVSFDYTLLHLYTPWAMLVVLAVQAYRQKVCVKLLNTVFVGMVLLLSPLGEIIYHGMRQGAAIKTVVLAFLFCLGVVVPFALPAQAADTTVDAA